MQIYIYIYMYLLGSTNSSQVLVVGLNRTFTGGTIWVLPHGHLPQAAAARALGALRALDPGCLVHGSRALGLAAEGADLDVLTEKPLVQLLKEARNSCLGLAVLTRGGRSSDVCE